LTESRQGFLARSGGAFTSFPVRLLVSAALLTAIALTLDWRQVGDRLADGSWGWFAAAVGVLAGALGFGAVRWHLLLRAAGLAVSRWQSARAYAIGLFANNFLPTSFGGDAARGLLVARGAAAVARSLTSVLVDRASAIVCLIVVGIVAFAVAPSEVPDDLGFLLLAVAGIGAIAVSALPALARVRRLRALLPERLRPHAREVRDTVVGYARDRRLVALVVVLGIAYQALTVASLAMIARAIELDLAFALAAIVLPLVLLATLFPISVAGFGVREGGFVVLLDQAGYSAADATLLSLLSVIAMALATSPGALALLTSGDRATLPAAAAGER
jgi:glycosyltransferase 2 family protein